MSIISPKSFILGLSKKTLKPNSTLNSDSIFEKTEMAKREFPPTSKKLSETEISCVFNVVHHISRIFFSAGVQIIKILPPITSQLNCLEDSGFSVNFTIAGSWKVLQKL